MVSRGLGRARLPLKQRSHPGPRPKKLIELRSELFGAEEVEEEVDGVVHERQHQGEPVEQVELGRGQRAVPPLDGVDVDEPHGTVRYRQDEEHDGCHQHHDRQAVLQARDVLESVLALPGHARLGLGVDQDLGQVDRAAARVASAVVAADEVVILRARTGGDTLRA